MDATKLFLRPGRLTRPAKICVILRGLPGALHGGSGRLTRSANRSESTNAYLTHKDTLPFPYPTQHNTGSGKTHLARMLRDIERKERGACRILCLDDYFLQVRVAALLWAFACACFCRCLYVPTQRTIPRH